ncbi:MAG: carbonic anhydrase [Sphingomonas sp.]|jgi:carbonic anhydrase|nr:MAG: carbonic anhydrase [Sphingomonas sp.]
MSTTTPTKQPTPDEALQRLKDGNSRFTHDERADADLSRDRRMALAKGQHPFATLVGCSDSRVGPEQLFGVGLGDLFIVRSAGNNVDIAGTGSVEYSVIALNVPLIVVLGHEACGAVVAATEVVLEDKRFPGSIGPMIAPIIPAVLAAQRSGADDLVEASVEENVRRVVERLQNGEAVLQDALENGKLKVVGAVYSLSTGEVRWLD